MSKIESDLKEINLPDDHRKLVQVFLIFLGVYVVNLLFPLTGDVSHTQRMWLLTSITVSVVSLYILFKEKLPSKKSLLTGLVLAILAGLVTPRIGIVTFFPFLAAMRIFEKTNLEISILKKPIVFSIMLGLGVGVVLGGINLLLSSGQMANFNPSFLALAVALNPGIHEEIVFRLFMYALSVYILGGQIKSRKERIWVYVLMMVPHVLLHFPDHFFINGVFTLPLGSLLSGSVILTLLFGLPLTLLMIKRDLTTSMIAHTIIDFIRFAVYGLPF